MAQNDSDEELTSPQRARGCAWVFLVFAISSSYFFYAFDNTVVANIRPEIILSLGEIDKLPWISVAYPMAEVGSNPFWGVLYRMVDAKLLYLASVAIFEIGSAVCGASPSANALIVGRVIAGFGGCGIYVGSLTIFAALTTTTERPLYLSLVGMAWCLGVVAGPLIGGAFADSSASWRWAFYINLCIAAVASPAYIWILPRCPAQEPLGGYKDLRKLDFVGCSLFLATAATIIMAIAFGGSIYSWNSWQMIVLFICFGVFWIMFIIQQKQIFWTTRPTRAFPMELAGSFQMVILFIETAAGISCIVVPIYLIPLFFQFVRGEPALQAGIHTLPFIGATVIGALLNGVLFERLSLYAAWFAAGGVLTTIGGALFYSAGVDMTTNQIYGYSVIIGLGAGLFAQLGFTVAQAKVEAKDVPRATTFIGVGQMAGNALAIGTSTSIFVNLATTQINRILPQANSADVQASIAGSDASFVQSLSPGVREQVLDAVSSTISSVFAMVLTAGALALVLSLFIRREWLFAPAKVQQDQEGLRSKEESSA